MTLVGEVVGFYFNIGHIIIIQAMLLSIASIQILMVMNNVTSVTLSLGNVNKQHVGNINVVVVVQLALNHFMVKWVFVVLMVHQLISMQS